MGTLYIVGTPIGNLGDFSPRAIETLKSVSVIAAEDTRLSGGLLNHFDIHTPVISYHQHNEKERGQELIYRIANGESVAIISDAGMPGISDPGETIVRLAREQGLPVAVIPGPTAVLSALAISGLPTRRFLFEGFLDGKESDQRKQLLEIQNMPHTLIFYEAPHKLRSSLNLLLSVLGNRRISLCRELTKMYEDVLFTTLDKAVEYYEENQPRGEFVLVIEGKLPEEVKEITLEEAVSMVLERHSQEVSLSQAAKEVAEITGHKKGTLYKQALSQ